jgi:ABC-type phosphate/phosphonate transport system ATPase subunit
VLDVSFGYDQDHLLFRDLRFKCDTDTRVAVVGPNGSGKTTLLRLITGQVTFFSFFLVFFFVSFNLLSTSKPSHLTPPLTPPY